MTANLQNVGAMTCALSVFDAAMQYTNVVGKAGASGLTRSAFYLTTGRLRVRTRTRLATKESAPPSPEARKFRDIKPFNLGMGKQT